MSDKDTVRRYLAAAIEQLEEERDDELDEARYEITRKYEERINVAENLLQVFDAFPDIAVPVVTQMMDKQEDERIYEDYPRKELTGQKILWAYKLLPGDGPFRQLEAVKLIRRHEPNLSHGAISTAHGRLVKNGFIDKVGMKGNFPLFKLAKSQVTQAKEPQLDFEREPASKGEDVQESAPTFEPMPPDYPATWATKIAYAIRKLDRFVHRSEIEAFLARYETYNKNTMSYTISTMFKGGQLIRVRFNNAGTMVFYGHANMVAVTQDGPLDFANPSYAPQGEVLSRANPDTMEFQYEKNLDDYLTTYKTATPMDNGERIPGAEEPATTPHWPPV